MTFCQETIISESNIDGAPLVTGGAQFPSTTDKTLQHFHFLSSFLEVRCSFLLFFAMASSNQNKDSEFTNISTEVLKLNFMKRTTVRRERQKRIDEQQRTTEQISAGKLEVLPPRHYPTVEHIDDDPNMLVNRTLGGVMTEWRYSVLMDNLRFGRFSFKGQNPEVEKWMLFHERRRLGMADEEEHEPEEAEQEEEEGQNGVREEGEISDDGGGGIVKLVEETRNNGRGSSKRHSRMIQKRTNNEKRRRKN